MRKITDCVKRFLSVDEKSREREAAVEANAVFGVNTDNPEDMYITCRGVRVTTEADYATLLARLHQLRVMFATNKQ